VLRLLKRCEVVAPSDSGNGSCDGYLCAAGLTDFRALRVAGATERTSNEKSKCRSPACESVCFFNLNRASVDIVLVELKAAHAANLKPLKDMQRLLKFSVYAGRPGATFN